MAPSLLDLPADIHLILIDHLVASIDEDQKTKYRPQRILDNQFLANTRIHPRSMVALQELRTTCKFYRDILAPRVFRTVILSNTRKSTESAQAIAKSPYRDDVQQLVFGGRMVFKQDVESAEEAIDASTEGILADLLGHFPNVRRLCVAFAYIGDLQKDFGQPESDSSAIMEEAKEPWRALMARVYDAIVKNDNSSGQIEAFEMRHLIPKPVSTYHSPAFKSFLSGIKRFDMSIRCTWNHDGATGWQLRGYAEYLSRLHLIFENLESCTDFKFGANRICLVGAQGHPPLDLRDGVLPKVRKMHLQHCILSTAVIAAITARAETLEELILEDYFACPDLEKLEWADAFTSFHSMQKLRRIEVWPIGIPWNTQKLHGGAGRLISEEYGLNDGDEVNARRTEEELDAGGPRRRLFPYGLRVDPEYNTYEKEILPFEILNRRKFLEGKDQAAWDILTKHRETTIFDDWLRCGYDERGYNTLEMIGTNYRVGQEPRGFQRKPLPWELRRSNRSKAKRT